MAESSPDRLGWGWRELVMDTTEIGGKALTSYIDWMFLTFAITVTGCPAVSIPCGLTRTGLPVGLQLIGPPHRDARMLSAAHALEELFGFAGRLPLRPRRFAAS